MDTAARAGVAPGMVTFVGAGPGDPDLMTIKGRKAIEEASLVLYAGSLVPREVVACAAPQAMVVDSAPLTLEQCHALVRATALEGRPAGCGRYSLAGDTGRYRRLCRCRRRGHYLYRAGSDPESHYQQA